MTRVIVWPACYGVPATVTLEIDGADEQTTDFDGGGNTYWANRHANEHAHELACSHECAIERVTLAGKPGDLYYGGTAA